MKTYVAATVLLVTLTACATKQAVENEPPSLVPPADVTAPASPAAEARLAELQTSMTELLERMDVLNARIARLESPAQNEPRVVQAPVRAVEPAPVPRAAEPAPALVPAPVPSVQPAQPAAVSGPLQSAAIADSYRGALILFGKGRMADSRVALQHEAINR